MEEIFDINGKFFGSDIEHKLDLFFEDEEQLTEFEQELRYWIGQSLCNYENNGCISDNMSDSVNIYLEAASKKLLDLARKEILKDLPKWKKENNHISSCTYYLENRGNGEIVLCIKGYKINVKDLEKLPKEEWLLENNYIKKG